MIVCYANGGGLGHLTRIRAYLHTTGWDGPVTILTGSPFADVEGSAANQWNMLSRRAVR